MSTAGETRIQRGPWYWEKFTAGDRHTARDLAALRKGVGRRVGDVPEMWPFYESIVSPTRPVHAQPRIEAEHAALALFALHQQSRRECMHRDEVGLGTAARQLRDSGRFSPEAVDRRMNQIATAADARELVAHLRGLVGLLRTTDLPLDYTRLRKNIEQWHYAEARHRIRAQWGNDYHVWRGRPEHDREAGRRGDDET
ncbi:type I-E CRISPR-associated protein Cse2/CasB [Streptomyces cacaoi]|uniref:type I-E CRISPR-associated protein Cse2/CasB n=1 Tax=Streptomyces cacaoi TaxID=1898 RepID=UPI0011F3893E|nr:type I-E CRISPR-associated protein Cse2/CasB [Streptomyces cacaoi]